MRLVYDVVHSGETGAGTHGYSDKVTIDIDSGDPGGDVGEFMEFMENALSEWFDGAGVEGKDVTYD